MKRLSKFENGGAAEEAPVWIQPAYVVCVKGESSRGTEITTLAPGGDSPFRIYVREGIDNVISQIEDNISTLTPTAPLFPAGQALHVLSEWSNPRTADYKRTVERHVDAD